MQAKEISQSLLQRMEGHEPIPGDFEFDGCTFAPDEIGGLDLTPACCVHDWDYSRLRKQWWWQAKCWFSGIRKWEKLDRVRLKAFEADRRDADQRLWRNMVICGASRSLADVYFRRCRFWGFPFAYQVEIDGEEKRGTPLTVEIRHRAKLLITRYLPDW